MAIGKPSETRLRPCFAKATQGFGEASEAEARRIVHDDPAGFFFGGPCFAKATQGETECAWRRSRFDRPSV